MTDASMAVGRRGFRPGKRNVIPESVTYELSLEPHMESRVRRSLVMGRQYFRPGKRTLVLGRKNFRPGKRSIVTDNSFPTICSVDLDDTLTEDRRSLLQV